MSVAVIVYFARLELVWNTNKGKLWNQLQKYTNAAKEMGRTIKKMIVGRVSSPFLSFFKQTHKK